MAEEKFTIEKHRERMRKIMEQPTPQTPDRRKLLTDVLERARLKRKPKI